MEQTHSHLPRLYGEHIAQLINLGLAHSEDNHGISSAISAPFGAMVQMETGNYFRLVFETVFHGGLPLSTWLFVDILLQQPHKVIERILAGAPEGNYKDHVEKSLALFFALGEEQARKVLEENVDFYGLLRLYADTFPVCEKTDTGARIRYDRTGVVLYESQNPNLEKHIGHPIRIVYGDDRISICCEKCRSELVSAYHSGAIL